jgi:hypothetical protein
MRPKSAPEPGFRKTPMFSGVRFCGRALIIDLKEVSREIVLPRTFFNIADAIQYTGPVTAVGLFGSCLPSRASPATHEGRFT